MRSSTITEQKKKPKKKTPGVLQQQNTKSIHPRGKEEEEGMHTYILY
jgi:hypothetical protein